MTMTNNEFQQRVMCEQHGTQFTPAPDDMKVGIACNVREGILPIHGLRHPPVGDTTGWYIWAGGEPSDDPDFLYRSTSSTSIHGALKLSASWAFRRDGVFSSRSITKTFGRICRF
jgi:hypothetical protein